MLERLHRPFDAVARDLIDSFGQDPELYVPGSVGLLSGTRTMTWRSSCSSQCRHIGQQCHRSHAAWLKSDSWEALTGVSAEGERRAS